MNYEWGYISLKKRCLLSFGQDKREYLEKIITLWCLDNNVGSCTMWGEMQTERGRGKTWEGKNFYPKLRMGNYTPSFCKGTVNLGQCHYGKHQLLHEAWLHEEEVWQSLHWSHHQQSYPEFQSQGDTKFHHIHQLHHHCNSFAVSHDLSNGIQGNLQVDTLGQANTMPSSYCACLGFCMDQFLLLHNQKKRKSIL